MKYAIIRTGGKQYRVKEGDVIEIERLAQSSGTIEFSDILFYTADGVSQVGQPTVAGVHVNATVLADIKGPKLRIAKFKAKARYRRTTGHRQSLSKVQIDAIGTGKAKEVKSKEVSTPVEKPTKATRTAKKS